MPTGRPDGTAGWVMPPGLDATDLRRRTDEVAARSQYGWGQTVRVGEVTVEGSLGDKWRRVERYLADWRWLPDDLTGAEVADIGCFSGALSLRLRDRGAARVVAVDEVPEHLAQAELLVELLEVDRVETVEASLYDLPDRLGRESLDLVLLSGVLYHLSDMLVGLVAVQQLLRPGGTLLLQSNAIENFEHSYANFGRFYAGWWWQPTARCIQDMAEFAGFDGAEVRFYEAGRCLARATKRVGVDPESAVPFKRGMHWTFSDLTDASERHRDISELAPAPDPVAEGAWLRRWWLIAVGRVMRSIRAAGVRVTGRARR